MGGELCHDCGKALDFAVDRDDETGRYHYVNASCPNRCREVAHCTTCKEAVGEYGLYPEFRTCESCNSPIHEEVADCSMLVGDDWFCLECAKDALGVEA